MRTNLWMVFALFILFSCSTAEDNKREKNVRFAKNYGPIEVDVEKSISVKDMLSDFEGAKEKKEYTFKGELTEVCSKAGCWVNVSKGNGETFMVRFKDHFTIPVETKVGKEAYFHGVAYMDTISVEMLRHFAEDAGKSEKEINEIIEPKFEFGFEADGIKLIKI